MLLTIDVGNTNSTFAVFQNESIIAEWRLSTNAQRTSDEYAGVLFPLMAQEGIAQGAVSGVILSSVVPAAVLPIKRFCAKYFALQPLVVGEAGVETGIQVVIDQPAEAGADMLVNAVAAWERHHKAMIIVDFGTATTFQVTNDKGDFVGGVIAPGINLSIEALHMAAAALPSVEVADPGKVIGTNTVGAIQAGIFYGYLGLIEGIVQRIQQEARNDMLVIATGGLAPLFAEASPVIHRVEQDLTMHGLHLIYHRNRK